MRPSSTGGERTDTWRSRRSSTSALSRLRCRASRSGALKMSPGVGIRARTDRRAIARLDWAYGSEGHRIVLDMGPVF